MMLFCGSCTRSVNKVFNTNLFFGKILEYGVKPTCYIACGLNYSWKFYQLVLLPANTPYTCFIFADEGTPLTASEPPLSPSVGPDSATSHVASVPSSSKLTPTKRRLRKNTQRLRTQVHRLKRRLDMGQGAAKLQEKKQTEK